MIQISDTAQRIPLSSTARAACHCRLCLALDEADAWIADHGGRPAQAARHIARQSPALLDPTVFLIALKKRISL